MSVGNVVVSQDAPAKNNLWIQPKGTARFWNGSIWKIISGSGGGGGGGDINWDSLITYDGNDNHVINLNYLPISLNSNTITIGTNSISVTPTSRTISTTNGLSGGGDLSQDRTIGIESNYKNALDSLISMFEIDSNGDIKTKDYVENGVTKHRGFYSPSFVSALGSNSSGGGGGGGMDIDAMWEALTTYDSTPSHIINNNYLDIRLQDLPVIPLNGNDVSGILPITKGGTGASDAAGARTNLGLGTMALEDATNYLPLSGGTMIGPICWRNSSALPERSSVSYFLNIDAFDDGGKTYWTSAANVATSLDNQHKWVRVAGDTMTGLLNIQPSAGNWCEGIRIYPYTNGWTTFVLGGTDLGATGTSTNTWSLHTYSGDFYLTKNGSNGITDSYFRSVSNKWYINTNSGSEALNVGGWVGTIGSTGWYNSTYQGGWYMSDANWIRSYNNKPVQISIANNNAWGIGTHRLGLAITGTSHVSWLLNSGSVGYGFCVNTDGNWYFGKRTSGSITDTTGDTYLLYGNNSGFYPRNAAMDLGNATYPWHVLYLGGSTSATMDNTTTNPRIVFQESSNPGVQKVALTYTDYDSYRASKGLKVHDMDGQDPGNVWFEVQGACYCNGLSSSSYVTALATNSSDKRLKKNIKSFNAIKIVDKLKPVQFEWNNKAKKYNENFKEGTNYGLIAQDSDGIIDDLVFDLPDGKGYKGVRYEKLIPILLQAIKELKQEINDLKNK